ncbi:PKS-NRPS hybrid synthetase [Fusarium oxysporum f. sp. conglutinans]|nr:PKS-NRPS hybrid synthetase [Fusarium oxysporum f. sp. conglutinans]
MDQFPDDCLPPEHTYASRDDLFQAINRWAAPRGYAFVTGRSNKGKSGRLTVYFTCDRARRPPSDSRSRIRATCTRSTLCPFSITAKELPDASGWVVRHRSDSQYATHNHTPSTHPTAHPVLRRLSKDDKSTISNLTKAGISSKEIRTYIRQHSNSIATQKDISNSIAEARRSSRFGQNTMHALINQLDQEGFWNRMQVDSEGRVTAVLFAHPESLTYLQAYPDLLLLDCTYETNRYGIPLLDIIGVDACQRSFCIAFAFLSGEEEQDYQWALERLKSLYEVCNTSFPSVIITDCALACINAVAICFPSAVLLLCLWHANKAVLAYCRPAFIQHRTDPKTIEAELLSWQEFYNQWHLIIQSADQVTFDQRVQQLEQRYLPAYANEIGYLHATWLNPHKEKLVKAWVDQHLHFGTVVTSRVEGIHSLLKSYLNTSTLDLFEAWGAITRAVTNQVHQLQSNQAQQQLR